MSDEERGNLGEGTVQWFDAVRGYGFIARDGAADLFVHGSEVEGEPLQPGERVSFEVAEGAKGLLAQRVRRL